MIYEIRTYRLKVGALADYVKNVTEEGISIQKKYLGNLVGYYFSEIGPLNEVVHIWAYDSLEEREKNAPVLPQIQHGLRLFLKYRSSWKKWTVKL